MAEACGRRFGEELLSGYLDGALTQGDAQRVRLHLEECSACRALYQEIESLRETTMSTRFKAPPDEQWNELPRTVTGRLGRSFGWLLVLVWLSAVAAYGLWRFLAGTGSPWEVFVVLGLPGGLALLFLSVLMDRLRDLKTDRYRGVRR